MYINIRTPQCGSTMVGNLRKYWHSKMQSRWNMDLHRTSGTTNMSWQLLQCVAVYCSVVLFLFMEAVLTQQTAFKVALTGHNAKHCNTLQYTAIHSDSGVFLLSTSSGRFLMWSSTLQHTAAHWRRMHHAAKRCNTLQHAATCCHTLHHAATHCNTLHYAQAHCGFSMWHHAAPCIKLQHTATHCNKLTSGCTLNMDLRQWTLEETQHTATYWKTLQYAATHCNTLQHVETHRNTLQHAATHDGSSTCHTTLQHNEIHCDTL